MVSKLWCQEIGRKWRQRRQEPPHARLLTEPKCQPRVAAWYLAYRWTVCLLWACFVVCSVLDIGSYQPLHMYDKWPIYLTNWDIALGFAQALVGGVLVSRRWRLQRGTSSDFDPTRCLRFGFAERLYWFLYVVTTNIAIGVTVTYWVAVHDPKIHSIDPLNIMIHVCNSLLMLIDLFVTSIPFRLRNFWWCLSIVMFYIIFSVIYYAAGGLDKHDCHYIYKILDWKKPVRTVLVCAGGLTFVTLLHCVTCMLAEARDRLYRKIAGRLGGEEAESRTATDDKTPPDDEKRAQVV